MEDAKQKKVPIRWLVFGIIIASGIIVSLIIHFHYPRESFEVKLEEAEPYGTEVNIKNIRGGTIGRALIFVEVLGRAIPYKMEKFSWDSGETTTFWIPDSIGDIEGIIIEFDSERIVVYG